MRKERKVIRLALLDRNEGQLDWLPKNPRQWTQTDIDNTAASIERDTDFLEDRPLLVVADGDRYCVFAGNLRREGCLQCGQTEAPCVEYFPVTENDRETVCRRAMLDNGSFGKFDWDELANDPVWERFARPEYGIPVWQAEQQGDGDGKAGNGGQGGDGDNEEKPQKEKIESVEAMLREVTAADVREVVRRIKHQGYLETSLTPGFALRKFIRAKYYGEHFPQYATLAFFPERISVPAGGHTDTLMGVLEKIAEGATEAGIAGIRTATSDGLLLLLLLLKGSYPIAGRLCPLDFPANTAAELIREFAGSGAAVLDPCHGWGGRLIGAMMADASRYVGIDPSPVAHRGVTEIADTFGKYAPKTKAEIIEQPFEDVTLDNAAFDFALTSPPYFDVEKYHGEQTSTARYPQFEKWVEHFYTPLLTKTCAALKKGGVFALNVGSQRYPLTERATAIAPKVGFAVEDIGPLGGSTGGSLHGNTDDDPENEKIIILRKL